MDNAIESQHKIKNNYIFIDESGKPEIYSAKGKNLVHAGTATKFLVLAAVRTYNQLALQQVVTTFKANLLSDPSLTKNFSASYSLDSFHAQIDYPEVREKFYNFISAQDIKIDTVVVDKRKWTGPLSQTPGKMYGVVAGQLLKDICNKKIFTRSNPLQLSP